MAKKVPEMSATAVRNLRHGTVKGDPRRAEESRKGAIGDPCVAYHTVGGVAGLLLQCRPPLDGDKIGTRSWILRITVGAKRRDIGLGGYPDVTLAQARERAREYRELVRQGIDPVIERQAARSALIASQSKARTFTEQSKLFVAKKSAEFKGRDPAKQTQRLETHLSAYVLPVIGKLLMQDIDQQSIMSVLMQPVDEEQKPLWEIKNPTAERIRKTIEKVWNMAKPENIVSGDNPAAWKDNLENLLVTPTALHKTEHQPTIGYHRLPAFMELLQQRETIPARALEFQILTAARPGEVRFAEWSEIDLAARLWIVPGHKIKNRKDHSTPHIVPLCDRAIEIINGMPREGEYVFPGNRGLKTMSDAALGKTVKAIHEISLKKGGKGFFDAKYSRIATAHGMRSCFKDFNTEETGFPDVLSELALSHLNSNATKAAYQRQQMVDRRRVMMAVYEKYAYTGVLPKADGGAL